MGESYGDYRKGLGRASAGFKKWLWEIAAFIVSSFAIWFTQKKWLKVVSGDWLEIAISIGVGLFFFAIYAYFHHRHLLWGAAWEHSNQQEEKIADLEKQLNVNVNYEEPDLHFAGAIELVKKLQPDKNYSTKEAQAQLVQKAFLENISVWGKLPAITSSVPEESNFVKMPHKFFYSPHGEPSDRGYFFNINNPLPGWKEWRGRNKYYYVIVNRRQIEAMFSNR